MDRPWGFRLSRGGVYVRKKDQRISMINAGGAMMLVKGRRKKKIRSIHQANIRPKKLRTAPCNSWV